MRSATATKRERGRGLRIEFHTKRGTEAASRLCITWLDAARRWEVPYEKKKPRDEANVPDEHAPTQTSMQSLGCWVCSDPRWGIERPAERTPLRRYAAAEQVLSGG
jgi:hypothetical protein